jgi:hypothetical protein
VSWLEGRITELEGRPREYDYGPDYAFLTWRDFCLDKVDKVRRVGRTRPGGGRGDHKGSEDPRRLVVVG